MLTIVYSLSAQSFLIFKLKIGLSHRENTRSALLLYVGFLKRIPGLKILRIYGQEIERKTFPVPDKITQFRSKHVSAQLKADEELRDVSLHHVIRSAECVKFAEILRKYDDEFKRWKRNDCRTCSKELKKKIQEFKKVEFFSSVVESSYTFITILRTKNRGRRQRVNVSHLPYLLCCLPYLFVNCLPPFFN